MCSHVKHLSVIHDRKKISNILFFFFFKRLGMSHSSLSLYVFMSVKSTLPSTSFDLLSFLDDKENVLGTVSVPFG